MQTQRMFTVPPMNARTTIARTAFFFGVRLSATDTLIDFDVELMALLHPLAQGGP